MAEDRAAGHRPAIVVATAGTTNTGAVDPLPELADLCAAEGLWLHVDGAYGAPAALAPSGRPVLAGLDRADSLVLDPHKWLFQPYDIGVLLVRRPGALERAFTMNPEYLADIVADDRRGRPAQPVSLELSRRARALKLWLTFRTYGSERIGQAIERGIASPSTSQSAPGGRRRLGGRHAGPARHRHLRPGGRLRRRSTSAPPPPHRGRLRRRLHHHAAGPGRPPPVHHQPADDRSDLDETLSRLADLIS